MCYVATKTCTVPCKMLVRADLFSIFDAIQDKIAFQE